MIEDADVLDAAYGVFATHLCMTTNRRRTILGRDRKVSNAVRDAMSPLIAPMPRDHAERSRVTKLITRDLESVAPYALLRRVPELWARRNESFVVLGGRDNAHYFEPWTDERGRVVALRAYMGKQAKPKYLATKGRTGPLVHFAFGVTPDRIDDVPWLFTEGWMKAEIAAHTLGLVCVALPGVSSRKSWTRAISAKRSIAPRAPSFVAYDAEVWTNRPHITSLALSLALELKYSEGRRPGFAVWDTTQDGEAPDPKGIDDALVAGVPVRLVGPSEFAPLLGAALTSWEAEDGN